MTIYLLSPFAVEADDPNLYKGNPPLSNRGIQQAKLCRMNFPKVHFDYCFTAQRIQEYSSAFLVVGQQMIIDRDQRLNHPVENEATVAVEKRIKNFLTFIEKTYPDKTILLVAEPSILKIIAQSSKNKTRTIKV